ncbi:YolD-like family protein [Metasolibacillus meyeri]|uniref:YolD-like family protein n=1 Tax=Metasolibacillus meyeri TaxID=1071052 RepID=UPI000D326719|nr:YolD-like family protein [Metasolibacillus meyeri]
MLKDRGIKKWQGMMMTEHVAALRKMDNELTQEQPKSLSDWELEDLQMTIQRAINENTAIVFDVWRENGYVKLGGTIKSINNNALLLETLNEVKSIALSDIHGANLNEYF